MTPPRHCPWRGATSPCGRSATRFCAVLRVSGGYYLFGHEHIIQDLKEESGVHFLNGPAGGQAARPARSGPLTLFSDSFFGFMALEIDRERIKVDFVDVDGKVRYQKEIR